MGMAKLIQLQDSNEYLFPKASLAKITWNSTATDFDSLTDMGIYYCGSITTNRPYNTQYWWVIVISDGGKLVRQIAFSANSKYVYTRYRSSAGTWQAWDAIVS